MEKVACLKCGKVFKNKVALASHNQVHKSGEPNTPGNGKPLSQVEEGLPGGDGKAPPTGVAEEAKSVVKETLPPPAFYIKATLRVDGDNLFLFYRAKQGGYPGDMSDFVNTLMREALQIRGYRVTAVLDPDMAQKVLQECITESETQGG